MLRICSRYSCARPTKSNAINRDSCFYGLFRLSYSTLASISTPRQTSTLHLGYRDSVLLPGSTPFIGPALHYEMPRGFFCLRPILGRRAPSSATTPSSVQKRPDTEFFGELHGSPLNIASASPKSVPSLRNGHCGLLRRGGPSKTCVGVLRRLRMSFKGEQMATQTRQARSFDRPGDLLFEGE